MSNFVLKGHVSYSVKKRYKWIADFGKNTCKKCAELNGREFDEDDVPFWPHPNCRCKVEEISVVDDITAEINEYKEELQQLKLQANELLGDSRVTRAKLENLLREHPTKEVKALDIKLVKVEFNVYKLIDKIEAYTIDTISKFEIARVQKRIEEYENYVSQCMKECRNIEDDLAEKKISVDKIVFWGKDMAPDAAALWVLSSSKFTRGLEYIEKNCEIVDKISDLKNEDLQKVVREKLNSQLGKTESRGVYFYSNSSLSKSISSSYEFKKIINKHKDTLINQKKVVTKESVFLELNLNNWLAIHGCDILNIRVDNGVLRATIVDTWDFNKNDKKVEIPRELQDAGVIENYFTIVEIAEPIEKYYSL